MSKREFLEVLRETLSEELSQNVVNGHIQYYDQYISDEIRKGASETEVTGRLGESTSDCPHDSGNFRCIRLFQPGRIWQPVFLQSIFL